MAVGRDTEPTGREPVAARAAQPLARSHLGAAALGEVVAGRFLALRRHLAARAELHPAAGLVRHPPDLGPQPPASSGPLRAGGARADADTGGGCHQNYAFAAQRGFSGSLLRRVGHLPLYSGRVLFEALRRFQHARNVRALVSLNRCGLVRRRDGRCPAVLEGFLAEVFGDALLLLRALHDASAPRAPAARGDQHLLQCGVPHHRDEQLWRDQVYGVQEIQCDWLVSYHHERHRREILFADRYYFRPLSAKHPEQPRHRRRLRRRLPAVAPCGA
mmetsp:Transcript_61596/g.201022  ORF Transcript_61596/g.201022 Transcript_61596/m.201022 type:complete len:274 (+) Transcript_61596:979-1800(+)